VVDQAGDESVGLLLGGGFGDGGKFSDALGGGVVFPQSVAGLDEGECVESAGEEGGESSHEGAGVCEYQAEAGDGRRGDEAGPEVCHALPLPVLLPVQLAVGADRDRCGGEAVELAASGAGGFGGVGVGLAGQVE
jgi:hypothetical protein